MSDDLHIYNHRSESKCMDNQDIARTAAATYYPNGPQILGSERQMACWKLYE